MSYNRACEQAGQPPDGALARAVKQALVREVKQALVQAGRAARRILQATQPVLLSNNL